MYEFFLKENEEDSGTKDKQLEHKSILEDDTTEDIVDEANVSGSDEGINTFYNF